MSFRSCSLAAALLVIGCGPEDPEVIVVHGLDEDVLVRSISFLGCKWDMVLAAGDATSPQFCLPGEDRVHFQKLDASEYCERQVEDGNIPELCACDEAGAGEGDPFDLDVVDREPPWFNYRTVSVKRVEHGSFGRWVLTQDDLEQDFAVPGPYGH
jgi:hypothetical protein